MKRMSIVVLLLVMASLALTVNSWAGRGRNQANAGACAVTAEQRQQFLADTAEQRQQMMDKQAQLNALLQSPNSDPAQIGGLEKEIYQLRQDIWAKAEAAGLPCPGGRGCGLAMGPGMGMGRGNGMCANYWRNNQ